MAPRKIGKIKSSLTQKGFRQHNTHHKIYEFYLDGKRTPVYTYISHGSDSMEYGDSLLNAMKKQLKFESKKDLENFIDCHLSEQEYVGYLKSKNLV